MSDVIFDNHRSDGSCQTFIIPLTYPDISLGADYITRIGYGGDIWELRVDLLSSSKEPIGKTNMPPIDYVAQQVKLLQNLSSMPILFTIRTQPQGGKFPDDRHEEALALMLMAIDAGCQYIDVEIEWPQTLIDVLLAKKGAAKLVASFHDWTSNIRWTGPVLQEKYAVADAFGDIIKLSILSADIYDCHELSLFTRTHLAQSQKPLLAVGMGQHGQLSRVLSPISLVTHRLLPSPSAPGQLTLAEVHQARHLVGQLPKREFSVVGDDTSGPSVCRMHAAAFGELGLPHRVAALADDRQTEEALRQLMERPGFGGAALVGAHAVKALGMVNTISDAAKQTGAVDVMCAEHSDGRRRWAGHSVLWEAIRACAVRAGLGGPRLNAATAIIVGGDCSFARTACYAAQQLGLATVRRIGRDGDGGGGPGGLTAAFPNMEIQEADSLESLFRDPVRGQSRLVIRGGCVSAGAEGDAILAEALSAGDQGGAVVDFGTEGDALASLMPGRQRWQVFGRRSILTELACRQFTVWTGRKAPESVMAEAI